MKIYKAESAGEAIAIMAKLTKIAKEREAKSKPKNNEEKIGQFFIDSLFTITKNTVRKGEELGLSEKASKKIIRIALIMLGEKATRSPLK